ncbi:MAG: hypothetical protein E3J21_16585 [Anaerolineales bacterium]|nr:MAG: hypothetical protein E3J21_16585 [Anaerolineales bacterium]
MKAITLRMPEPGTRFENAVVLNAIKRIVPTETVEKVVADAINWVSQSETTAVRQALISKRYTASVLLQALAQIIQQI